MMMTLLLAGCGQAAQSPTESDLPTQSNETTPAESESPDDKAQTPHAVPGAGVFDLETGTVMLNNGIEMPILGLGTYRLSAEETVISVKAALASGYSLIDTAAAYGNEEAVGQGIKESGVAREDIFISTKLWPNDYSNAAAAIDTALEKLDVEYIDLLLLH